MKPFEVFAFVCLLLFAMAASAFVLLWTGDVQSAMLLAGFSVNAIGLFAAVLLLERIARRVK